MSIHRYDVIAVERGCEDRSLDLQADQKGELQESRRLEDVFLQSKSRYLYHYPANIILHIENDDIYEIKPDLLPILVKNQTNKKLLELSQLS